MKKGKKDEATATLLTAGVPDANGNVYTEGTLFDIACKNRDKGAKYDVKTKTLTFTGTLDLPKEPKKVKKR